MLMKDKILSFAGMGIKGRSSSDPLITHLSPTNHPLLQKAWKYTTCMILALLLGVGNMWAADPDVDFTMSSSTKGDYFKAYTVGTNTVTVSTSAGSISSGNGGYYIDLGSNASAFGSNYLGVRVSGEATISKVEILASGSGNNKSITAPVVGWEDGWDGSSTTADAGLTLSYTTPSSNGSKFSTAEWREADVDSWDATEVRIYKKLSSVTVTGYTLPTTAETIRIWGVRVYLNTGGVSPVCPSGLTISSKDSKTAFTEGEKVELTAALSAGNGDISYQWYKGSVAPANAISGATTNKLTINSCAVSDAGDYFCVASKTSCPDAVNASAFAITVAADPKCFSMPLITSKPADLASVIVTGGTLTDANAASKAIEFDAKGLKFGGSAARLKVTLSSASIVEGTKITVTYECTSDKGSGIAIYNGDYASKTMDESVSGKGSGSWEHTFTAAEAANYADEFMIDRNGGGGTMIVRAITIEACGPAVTKHTITLNYNDGETANGSLTVVDGRAAAKPADPTWEHHRFDGWYNGASPYVWTATVSGDLTLTAHWTQLYTVTYAKGDEGATGDAPTQADKAATETFKVAANTFELAGKVFDHWNDGTADYDPEDTYTVGTSNVTLTAVWRTPSTMYAITKGAHENGDFTIDPASQEAGEVVTLEATPDADYLFSAWEVVKTEDGTNAGVTVTNGEFTMPAFAVTVNATFVADTRKKILYLVDKLTSGNWGGTESDKLYAALKDDYNVTVAAPAGQTLTDYDLIVLHESIGGTNSDAAVSGCKTTTVPVLNTKSFFYGSTSDNTARWGWGKPNAGTSVKGATQNSAYCNIASHPLFDGLTITDGFFEITDEAAAKCMQPVGSFTSGKEGYTLATTPNSGEGNGCAIHELTPAQRGASAGKYLMISVSNDKLNALNANGQKLFQNAAAYLIGSSEWSPVLVPTTPEITGITAYSAGETIELTASATGESAATTYTWYKGATLEAAKEAGAIQAAKTVAENGNVYSKAECVVGDAGTYWCVISNGTDCDVNASLAITVSDISYAITFVSAHGTAPTTTDGVSYTLPELTESGWAHQGWRASIDVTVDAAVLTAGELIETGKTASFGADVEFTAVWAEVYAVTFNMHDHGDAIDPQAIVDGGKVTKPADPSASGWIFGGWYKEPAYTNAWDFANDKVTAATELHAKWTEDPCPDPKSLSKVVLTSASAGTVSGYNGDEYAGAAVIDGLSDTQTAEVDASHEGVETGYKMNGKGSAIVFATLKKGTFQEGDRVIVTITKKNDAYKEGDVAQNVLHIYYGTNASDATKLTTLEGVSAAGSYTYRLTAADITAIGTKTGIGVFRESTNGQNPYVYSVEITGCRSWAVTHDVNFNMMGHGEAITKIIEVGAKVTEPAEPAADGYIFDGWYKENTLVNKWNFDTDVMPDNDITLYAKWSEDPCPTPFSLSKVVLTSATTGPATGYNSNEYAGDAVINGLSGTETAEVDASHDGTETGYKMNSGGSAIVFATLKKGAFQAGDRVVVTITKEQDSYKVESVSQNVLHIYYGTNASDATKLTTIEGVNAAGTYTYRLKDADITAIGDKKGIGLFREGTNGQNPYVYSVEIAGCRSWAVFHTLTFKNNDGSATIATESLEEGAFASTVAPTAPKITLKRFIGWAEDIDGTPVTLASYTITTDKTLYAVYEDIVCPTSGTIFSMVPVANDLSSDYQPTGTEEVSISEYANIANGEVYICSNGTDKRVKIVKETSVIQLIGGENGYIHVLLECPLKENDIIRFDNNESLIIAYNSLKTNSVTIAKTDHQFAVPAAWADKTEFFIWRNGNNATISSIEVYRRPALTGASLENLTMRVGLPKTPVLHLLPSEDAIVTSQTWEIFGTPENLTGASINATTGEITSGTLNNTEENGTISVKVTLNGNIEATCTVTVVNAITQQNVEKSTLWDWTKAGSTEIKLTDSSDPKKTEEFVMANVAVNNDADFESDKLVVQGEYILREPNKTGYFQGNIISFKTTDEGLLKVNFSGNNNNSRVLKVYDNDDNVVAEWAYNSGDKQNQQVKVPAGAVTLKAFEGEVLTNVRIYKIEFLTLEQRRKYSWIKPGELGTVCLKNDAVAVGADIYELQGPNEYGKLVFDQTEDNKIEAGKPYVFSATATGEISFYTQVNADHTEVAGKTKGMYGTFSDKTFDPSTDQNIYYFSGHAIYGVKNWSSTVTIPAYLCYLDMVEFKASPAPSANPAPGRRRIVFDVQSEQVATGIGDVQGDEVQSSKVLINGQLFILRGEKMYDATGRLVK